MHTPHAHLTWLGIARLGLVQASLGAIVVLTTATLNRVMVVELALPAMLPGALVALHYFVQILRPRLGHGSDVSGRRTPWIVGGMAALSLGGIGAALATAAMATNPLLGIAAATLAFTLIGVGVGAAGTNLLVLLAKRAAPERRAAAATIVWLMMIVGFIITAGVAGAQLDPFSFARLLTVTAIVCALAFVLACLAVAGVEGRAEASPLSPGASDAPARAEHPAFMAALREVWAEPRARRFAVFVFVAMLAYSAQDLILEPFAGTVFGMTPGESTQLAGVQHSGVFVGMVLVAIFGTAFGRGRPSVLRSWTIGGCIASSLCLITLAAGGLIGQGFPLKAAVFALGCANGAFAVAAIGSMMALVAEGAARREGVRMGLWGAAQALAFGLGGFLGTVAIDIARATLAEPAVAYATVFALEGLLFLSAGTLAARVDRADDPDPAPALAPHALAAVGGGD